MSFQLKEIFFLLSLYLACANADRLSPSGANVCRRTVTTTQTYISIEHTIRKEKYQTCCGLLCFRKCKKTRTKRVTFHRLRTRSTAKTIYFCCNGYEQRGNGCPIAICNPPCRNNGDCFKPNRCRCRTGFRGSRCQYDVNECAIRNGGCQQRCVNLFGSYKCECFSGYKIGTTPKKCEDINECSTNKFLCECIGADFVRPCAAFCVNTIGSYRCACSKGYELQYRHYCRDIDECKANNGNCDHRCHNTNGGYRCHCDSGYELDEDRRTCNDINECSFKNGGCEDVCENKKGSFTCKCSKGLILDGNGKTCSDHDECKGDKHGCQQLCENLHGSYICGCSRGYKLNVDNRTCSDINECETIPGHNTTLAGCDHRCTNTNGSYLCSCNNGYALSTDKRTCEDIDECSNGNNSCTQICINSIGSYSCRCFDGYELADNKITCIGKPCESLPLLTNGNHSCTYTSNDNITNRIHGITDSSCKFTCNRGFTLKGSETRLCLPNSKWNGTFTFCERRDCPSLPPFINGSILLPCQTKFGSKCNVFCREGFILNGSKTIECKIDKMDNLKWIVNGQCKALPATTPSVNSIKKLKGGVINEKNGNDNTGRTVTIALVIICVCLLLGGLILYLVRNKGKYSKKSLTQFKEFQNDSIPTFRSQIFENEQEENIYECINTEGEEPHKNIQSKLKAEDKINSHENTHVVKNHYIIE